METSSNGSPSSSSKLIETCQQYTCNTTTGGAAEINPPLPLPNSSSSLTCELADDDECFEELSSEAKEECLNRRHQYTYSDSMLTQLEAPCWLKDLLDDHEPPQDTPSRRSHRRSSSDSIAYIQKTIEKAEQQQQDQDQEERKPQHHNFNIPSPPISSSKTATDSSSSSSKLQQRVVKRHSAQQNRARKVHYIAELERSVEALQLEGYQVSAELEFLDQQNLILGMENRVLKQRLDTLSQEHFIKCLEQEVLEREITRLRNFYQQQHHIQQLPQQQQQLKQHYGTRNQRSKRQDLDSSFAKLSLKNKGAESQKAR